VYPKFKTIVILLGLFLALCGVKAVGQALPLQEENTLTSDWVVTGNDNNKLVPYAVGGGYRNQAIHQWLQISTDRSFSITFAAPEGLCLFLNNQLIFTADSTASYTINLANYAEQIKSEEGKYLLTVWHPKQQPIVGTFKNTPALQQQAQQAGQKPLIIRAREYINKNSFILFMLLIGLLYGALRSSYTADFKSLYSINSFFRVNALQEGFLAKPLSSWSSILFIVVFSLSLALLIAAIHTNVQHIRLLNQFFPVSEADISTKVLVYTITIFLFILLKYLFLKVMSYIFGLENVVQLQYREFLRTILFLGIFLPAIILFYLAFNTTIPNSIVLISNLVVGLVLVITVVRVFATVNTRVSVLNLHLFSYLCATEVIPLAIILKLIVFNF
jgi:hypothetical protein